MPSHEIRSISVGPLDNDVYAIVSAGEALIIDGADEPERIIEMVEGLRVVGVAQTHNHPDHTGALASLVDAYRVPVYAHPDDRMPVPTAPLADEQLLQVGDVGVRALHTPGHTPGSTCYLVGDDLCTGDTLFPGGPGNTDGDPVRFGEIMGQVDRLMAMLADEVRILPGHGAPTTIGRERAQVETWRSRGW